MYKCVDSKGKTLLMDGKGSTWQLGELSFYLFLVCSQCTCHFRYLNPSLLIVINGKLQMDHMCDEYARDTFSAQVEQRLTKLGRVARSVVLDENGCFDFPVLKLNHELIIFCK